MCGDRVMGLLLTLLALVAGARGLQQPNIIIILADDIGEIDDTQQSVGCGDVVTSACNKTFHLT